MKIFKKDKKINPVIAIMLSLIAFYSVFITVEAVRLQGDIGKKPVITVAEERTRDSVKYYGLGYSVIYRFGEWSEGTVLPNGCGAEFRLFDKILLWGWIE